MDKTINPIAKVTGTSGLKGDVRLKPLSRYFDKYINRKNLMVGHTIEKSNKINVETINGEGKKRRFKFRGFDSINTAKTIIGKTIFVQTSSTAQINLISEKVLGYKVVDEAEDFIGNIIDVMWLPNNDAYIIKNGKKEYLIPIVPEIIKKVEHTSNMIIIKVMDGLLN